MLLTFRFRYFQKKKSQPVTIFGRRPYDLEEHPINLVTSSPFLPFSIGGEQSGSSQEPNPAALNALRRAVGESSSNSQERPLSVASNDARDSPIKYYCIRTVEQQTEVYNDNILDCNVTFVADKNICVLGIQVPSQILNMVTIGKNLW